MKTDFNATAQRRNGAGIGTVFLCVFASSCLCIDSVPASDATNPPEGMVQIPAGVYRPLVRGGTDLEEVLVKAFYLDIVPVPNGDYLKFVRANPIWQRSNVRRIFADESYLKNWQGDLEPGSNAPANAP